MTIKLIAIGKTDKEPLKELIETYQKRLKYYIKFNLEIIPDIKKSNKLSIQEQKQKEGTLILSKLQPTDVVILLDENGEQFTSLAFSKRIQKHLNSGIKNLVFVIGGPYGFSQEVYNKAKYQLSFSKMTFSHQMIRVFFIEQIYRAFTILNNEPYHHQ